MTTATDATLPVTGTAVPFRARLLDLARSALSARYGIPPPQSGEPGDTLDEAEVRAYVALISAVHF